jgi:hypothetical protein
MRSIHPTSFGALLLCAGLVIPSAAALADGAFSTVWRQVNNRYNTVTGEATGLHGAFYTFDLFLQGAAGTRINAINMGYVPDPSVHDEYIYQNGNVYENELSSMVHSYFRPHPGIYDVDPAAEFDSFVAIGDAMHTELASVGSVRLDSNIMRGIWLILPETDAFPATIDESGEIRIMRLTVSSDTTVIGGLGSRIQIGTILEGDPATPTEFIPVAVSAFLIVPAPSAAGVFALAGLAIARRRR